MDTIAVVMVTPADGPSLGIAPAGTWIWISVFSKKSLLIPNVSAWERTYESAACADSFITSPSCPVSVSCLFPGIIVASIKRMSPPVGVQASPVTTPGRSIMIAVSAKYRGLPR